MCVFLVVTLFYVCVYLVVGQCVLVYFKNTERNMSKYLLNHAQGLSLPVGCISSLPLERSASEPGARWRS